MLLGPSASILLRIFTEHATGPETVTVTRGEDLTLILTKASIAL